MKNKWNKMSLIMIMSMILMSFSLFAADEEAVKFGRQHLEEAYDSYMNSKLPNALFDVNLSTDYNTTSEALAFKVQLEYAMGDRENADNTLKAFKYLYPDDINGNVLSALLLSLEYKDGNEILKNIETALKGAKSEEQREDIIALVEQEDSFKYFRVVCEQQYNSLEQEILKLNSKLESEGTLKQGVTKWEAKPLGPRLWLSDEACKNLHNGTYVADKILRFVPQPYRAILKVTLKISDKRIQNANKKHRGVIMSWTWLNAGSATFAVKPQ
jgi:hypothetical protein